MKLWMIINPANTVIFSDLQVRSSRGWIVDLWRIVEGFSEPAGGGVSSIQLSKEPVNDTTPSGKWHGKTNLLLNITSSCPCVVHLHSTITEYHSLLAAGPATPFTRVGCTHGQVCRYNIICSLNQSRSSRDGAWVKAVWVSSAIHNE